MKNTYFLIIALLFSSAVIGQEKVEEKKEPIVKFSGYIAYRAFIDTYDSYDAREGSIYLFPKEENLDPNGDDINQFLQHESLALDTRMRAKITGPDAFGAKVTGLIEADWMGSGNSYVRMPRLRHAFVKLSWSKVNLLAGQYWHPVFTPECFPATISFGAGLPFNPLNRAPQARITLVPVEGFELFAAITSYGYHNFSGTDLEAQRNSSTPDIHFQAMYKSKPVTVGIVGGIKTLKPRLQTGNGIKTKETLSSFDVKGFIKVNISDITLKWSAMYGQNLSPYVMIGGYGAEEDPTLVDDYKYANMNTLSAWFDGEVKINAMKIGLFYGYSANLGSSTDYYTLGTARKDNLNNIMRVAPRATFTSGKVSLSFEYMLTTAVYGNTWDANHKVEDSDDMLMNHRTMLALKYVF